MPNNTDANYTEIILTVDGAFYPDGKVAETYRGCDIFGLDCAKKFFKKLQKDFEVQELHIRSSVQVGRSMSEKPEDTHGMYSWGLIVLPDGRASNWECADKYSSPELCASRCVFHIADKAYTCHRYQHRLFDSVGDKPKYNKPVGTNGGVTIYTLIEAVSQQIK